jgi:hypothetical protein
MSCLEETPSTGEPSAEITMVVSTMTVAFTEQK